MVHVAHPFLVFMRLRICLDFVIVTSHPATLLEHITWYVQSLPSELGTFAFVQHICGIPSVEKSFSNVLLNQSK